MSFWNFGKSFHSKLPFFSKNSRTGKGKDIGKTKAKVTELVQTGAIFP